MKTKRSIKLIVDLQFGSTGKGLIAGFLAKRDNPDTIITAWAANAGHTYIDDAGRKYVHTMLANGVVSKGLKRVLLGPGSLINPQALTDELISCRDHLIGVKILIHPQAAIITQKHIDLEQGPMTKIGSTKKGVGEAMIDRIRRNPDDNNTAAVALKATPLEHLVCTVAEYNAALDAAEIIQVEGAQGYSLSMYHGLYPYTTSRDVTPAQIFADCALPIGWWSDTEVVGTVRSFPIRVANRFDGEGKQVGYSGGCYPDQHELAWSALGMEAELTTVTKLPRRIFTISKVQIDEAMRQCSVDTVFFNFANYCRTPEELLTILQMLDTTALKYSDLGAVCFIGFGPGDEDVMTIDVGKTTAEEVVARWEQSRLALAEKFFPPNPATGPLGGSSFLGKTA